jgi:S2P endopeptidase
VLPAAFVALDAPTLQSKGSKERLRVIAAGAFHNIVCYGILLAWTWLGIGVVLLPVFGYDDVSKLGVVVLDIEQVRIS